MRSSVLSYSLWISAWSRCVGFGSIITNAFYCKIERREGFEPYELMYTFIGDPPKLLSLLSIILATAVAAALAAAAAASQLRRHP